MISPSNKKPKNKEKHKHKEKEKDKEKDFDSKYKTSLYQNETNYTIKLLTIDGKLQIYIKSSKSFSEDIYEFSNTYSFRQLQITNKYFSNFNNIEEVCIDLDKLLKLKVIVEEEKDKTLILKIPTSMDKSSGDIIFKLMKTKKVKKVRHSSRDKIKINNIDIINKKLYETNIPGNTNLLLGNISDLVDRVKKLEKKEIEKDKTITKLKEEMNNYQEKLNNSYNYPIYSPLAKKSDIKINLADDKNNNISKIIKNRNEDDDDDDIDINFENDTIKDKKNKKKKKSKTEIKNKSDSDNDGSSDSAKKKKKKKKSDSFLDESKKDDSDEDKSKNILLKSANRNFNINDINNINNYKPPNEAPKSGFPIIKRDENLKEYINSRIFYTIREMQTIKKQITKGQRNLHAYFDLLYRASVDGDEESKIDSFCKGRYPQLILFFTHEGARFGVYVDKVKTKTLFKKEDYYKEPQPS